jgi:hypothetical protein
MLLVIVPACIRGERQLDVSSFAESMLGSISTSDFNVQLITTIAGRDDNWLADEGAEGLEDFLAELLEDRNKLRRNSIVNVVLFCSCRLFELFE